MAKDWTIAASQDQGQLLAQMSALRDDAGAAAEHACEESSTWSPTRKDVSILNLHDLGMPTSWTFAHHPHQATHICSSGHRLFVSATC